MYEFQRFSSYLKCNLKFEISPQNRNRIILYTQAKTLFKYVVELISHFQLYFLL